MGDFRDFFCDCADVVGGGADRIRPNAEVGRFLDALGYLPADGDPSSVPEPTRRNRQALLSLASYFDRVFELPMRHAPGAVFFGGMISPAALGIEGHGDAAIGAGGRGETLHGAFESCIGEAAEYLSFIEWNGDPHCRSLRGYHGLDEDELAWSLAGIGLGEDADLEPLDWVEARSLDDDRPAFFPSELILRRPEAARTGPRQAESTGVAAGPTLDAAIRSGLLEVLERDAIALWWYGGLPAGALDADVEGSADFDSFVRGVRGDSTRRHWFLDLTTDLGVPVVAALSSEPDGSSVVGGFAAHVSVEQAARRAFLEMCQMELARDLSLSKLQSGAEETLQPQDRIWIERHRRLHVDHFPQFAAGQAKTPASLETGSDHLAVTLDRLKQNRLNAYVVDLSRENIAIPAVKIIIPHLQSVKPDWVSKRLRSFAEKNNKNLSDALIRISPI